MRHLHLVFKICGEICIKSLQSQLINNVESPNKEHGPTLHLNPTAHCRVHRLSMKPRMSFLSKDPSTAWYKVLAVLKALQWPSANRIVGRLADVEENDPSGHSCEEILTGEPAPQVGPELANVGKVGKERNKIKTKREEKAKARGKEKGSQDDH